MKGDFYGKGNRYRGVGDDAPWVEIPPPAITTVYVVQAYRWGDAQRHSYCVGVFTDKNVAVAAADNEELNRGGKYGCEVTLRTIGLDLTDDKDAVVVRGMVNEALMSKPHVSGNVTEGSFATRFHPPKYNGMCSKPIYWGENNDDHCPCTLPPGHEGMCVHDGEVWAKYDDENN